MKRTILPAILLAFGALAYQAKTPELDSRVTGPVDARVGELITLEAAPADRYDWEVLSAERNYKVINGGASLIFSAEHPGNYLFVCALTTGGLVDIVVHRVAVGKEEVRPTPNLSDFEILVQSWLPEGYNQEAATRLAYSFDVAASAPNRDIDGLIKLTTLGNRAALGPKELPMWLPFLKAVSLYCRENMRDATLDEHVQLWLNLSVALRKA